MCYKSICLSFHPSEGIHVNRNYILRMSEWVCVCERDLFERKNNYKSKEKENHSDFRIPTKEYFLDCNYGFVHRWIRLIFGLQVLYTWYFKFFDWIGKNISIGRDKCFALFALYFWVLSSSLYCTNWVFVLIWLFVTRFSAFVRDSLNLYWL